jgi:hypothetical protein
LGEAVIIVASVFVAIYLEGIADNAARRNDARASLTQLVVELKEDREEVVEVRGQQMRLRTTYDDLLRWLSGTDPLPADSVQAALDEVAFLNRTVYPRAGTWSALTSSDHLSWVSDEDLVARLANFYESMNARLESGGRDYDFNVNEVVRVTLSRGWDSQRQSPQATNPGGTVELREQLRYLRLSWNRYYVDRLDDHEAEIDGLIQDLETYLAIGDN